MMTPVMAFTGLCINFGPELILSEKHVTIYKTVVPVPYLHCMNVRTTLILNHGKDHFICLVVRNEKIKRFPVLQIGNIGK